MEWTSVAARAFGRHAEGVRARQDLIWGVQEAARDAAIDRANF
jgi:hypothetical protein